MKKEDLYVAVADLLWPVFDHDNDGKIGFDEFSVAVSVICKGTPEQKTKLYWSAFDRDGNGELSKDELITLFKMLAKGIKINFIVNTKKGYRELNLKQKGISKSTFHDFIDKVSKKLDSDDIAKIAAEECLDYSDTNKDGKLSREEYAKWSENSDKQKDFREKVTKLLIKEIPESNSELEKYVSEQLRV